MLIGIIVVAMVFMSMILFYIGTKEENWERSSDVSTPIMSLLVSMLLMTLSFIIIYGIGDKNGQVRILSGQEAQYELIINDDKTKSWVGIDGE